MLTLGVAGKHKFLFDKINQPDFKKKVGNYLTSFWGPGYNLNVVLSEGGLATGGDEPMLTPKALGEKIQHQEQLTVRQQVESHPLVQSANAVFKTEIKSIKEKL